MRALVTGVNQGIGKHVAATLAECGAEVFGLDKTISDNFSKELPNIKPIKVDLQNWDETEKAICAKAPFHLLVNNAGIAILGTLVKIKEDDVDKMLSINVKAVVNVTRIVVRGMVEEKIQGSIVNISSQASLVGLSDHNLYCTTKAAIDGFTRQAALEYGPNNIRVNAVNPTVIMTEMGKRNWSDPKIAEPMLAKMPLRRFGEVYEVTYPILFLLSDKASLITGVCLPIDAGYTAV
ncbi:D-erythrulose reductase-like [Diorhabda sublineata]|nr:D-erythrulose reductase-like [Diorhabda sublineata]